ncbi:hypothetical protein PtB15_16B363 [Puccinia triticina]|nr:hypothetical protein PtB15_16B363 [Puccinia triticina]
MLETKLISREILPDEWFHMIESLMCTIGTKSSSADVQLEQAVLQQQHSDGEENEGPNEDDDLFEDED